MRRCKKCGLEKEISEFHPHKLGIRYECKLCQQKRSQLYRYGLTPKDFKEMLLNQNNACKLCKKTDRKLGVDHDHKTGRVRGLLCLPCNSYLGTVEQDVQILDRIKEYLT